MSGLRNITLAATTMVALGLGLFATNTEAQQKSLKDQLVGSWTVVSAVDIKPDGAKVDAWGANPKGTAIYGANGRYAFMLMRSDLPKFASNSRAQPTADEGKAISQGTIAYFGTYTVNEADKSVTFKVEGSSYPNIVGVEQKRIITSITADEMKYTNPASTTGTKVEAVWKRAN